MTPPVNGTLSVNPTTGLMAYTHDGVCLGCHIELPPMMFHQMLSQERFEECPNCHRIVYRNELHGDDAEDQDAAEKDAS